MNFKDLRVCVLGLGYVGLPLAVAFGKAKVKTYGFDLNRNRIEQLKSGFDKNNETGKKDIIDSNIEFSPDPKTIGKANFVIVCVPTPVDDDNNPDLSFLESASRLVGKNIRKNSYVVFESTVYPGATEEVCIPLIEKFSGFKAGVDFYYGYSPERINPGDKVHTLEMVVKIVSGMDEKTLRHIANVYGEVCKAGVYKASSVKVAEAAKVIENTQRDLNIALVNELSIIFHKIGIDTKDVIDAASTKWNYMKFTPGLVGGHCVGVDPFYLVSKSLSLGYNPKVIGAGRETNDGMAKFVVLLAQNGLKEAKKVLQGSKVLILGLTFKENISDLRNSKVFDIIDQLKNKGAEIYVFDPLVSETDIKNKSINFLHSLRSVKVDCVIFCVSHKILLDLIKLPEINKICKNKPVLIDVKNVFEKKIAIKEGFIYRAL